MKQYQVEVGTNFIDERGIIQNVLNGRPINAVAIITSKAGSERSNHYHLKNDHFLYVVSGEVEYYERDLEEDGTKVKPIVFVSGEMIYTASMKVHKIKFLEYTVLLSLGTEVRDHQSHESDLVRVEF